jgi:hypothetical protein
LLRPLIPSHVWQAAHSRHVHAVEGGGGDSDGDARAFRELRAALGLQLIVRVPHSAPCVVCLRQVDVIPLFRHNG